MLLSLGIAQILSLFYIIFGISILFNKSFYHKFYTEVFKNPVIFAASGVVALFVGIFLVLFHNFWIYSWETIITLIGWLALVKGLLILLLPEQIMGMANAGFKQSGALTAVGIFALILGLVLGYFGFFI